MQYSAFGELSGLLVNMPALVLRSLLSYTVIGLCIYCLTYGNVPVPAGCVAQGESELAEVLRTFTAFRCVPISL